MTAFVEVSPVDAWASTEQLLHQRDQLPLGHRDRAVLRTRAIEKNLPMATRLARRYAGRGELLEDLTQVAAMALINAVDRYDASRQVPFVGFAIPTILGSLKRHFRDAAWGVRVPRPVQELALKLGAATATLAQRDGHTPSPAELAHHLLVSVDDISTALGSAHAYRPLSLNTPSRSIEGTDLADTLGETDRFYGDVDDQVSLRPVLAMLASREQRILTMRFYHHMSQSQIAAEIGVSQMQISRLLKRSLAQLRDALVIHP